ncbi:MAG: hypothetical protein RLZZ416_580 [Candidatus Parcubacteria bacterium]|jgi:hypothetical protein
MTDEELQAFTKEMSRLAETGDEAKVKEYVASQYDRLPETMRQDILFHSLYSAVQDELEEQAVTEVMEQGIAVAEELEKAKEEIKKEGLTG